MMYVIRAANSLPSSEVLILTAETCRCLPPFIRCHYLVFGCCRPESRTRASPIRSPNWAELARALKTFEHLNLLTFSRSDENLSKIDNNSGWVWPVYWLATSLCRGSWRSGASVSLWAYVRTYREVVGRCLGGVHRGLIGSNRPGHVSATVHSSGLFRAAALNFGLSWNVPHTFGGSSAFHYHSCDV